MAKKNKPTFTRVNSLNELKQMCDGFTVGDKVKWYDPDIEARDLDVIWTISKIYGDLNDDDTIILITSEYGSEAEVYKNELKKDFFIQLNFGIRSSKSISYNKDTDTFYIINNIDGTEQELNSQTIMDEEHTNIGKAITLGAFYVY